MPTSRVSNVIQHLRRAGLVGDEAGLTDGQLLDHYLDRHNEAALAALVRRHGPMVWGVCRRVLHNHHDAEDAFQATFLVLVRRAASIASRELLANWLYGVAHQTALKARATAARRTGRERQVNPMPEPAVAEQDLWRDLRPLLDQEMSRLPDKYRAVLVLCDLEGNTRKEAARRLGVPEGTVAGRLARARTMLAKRLVRQGVVLSGGVLAAMLSHNVAAAGVPALLVSSTIQAATLYVAGPAAAAGVISHPVAALAEGVLKTMFMSKMKPALWAVLAIGLIAASWGVYGTRAADPSKPEDAKTAPAAPAKQEKINLPTGPAPIQVLASIDKEGKLVIKTATPVILNFNVAPLPLAPPVGGGGPNGGAAPAIAPVQVAWELRPEKYDLDDVEVLDTQGKKLAKKDVAKQLKEETVALASMGGQPLDPLHLRVLKPGTLVFVLPVPKNVPGGGLVPQGNIQILPLPLPAPVVPPAIPPGADGTVPPANTVPAQGPRGQ